ncbi:HIT family protein [Mycolicibacterium fortuitum]|uniref:HIT family protein n=1 Tax=Mycolicibacterium fortuitum TaxID=1766 RepID=UPI002615D467|nr:HIT family protein [Mycolicibacterium fortuitum]
MSCVFCPANWPNLDIVQDTAILRVEGERRIAILNPLNPVTDGHVLVISSEHSDNAAEHPGIARDLMQIAAQYVADQRMQANIITSIGPDATQTVMHTHVHVVPRRLNDDLPLPWTPQQMERERWRRALEVDQ